MRSIRLGLTLMFGLMFGLLLAWTVQAQSATTLEWGRQYATWFYSGELEPLFAKFTPEVKQGLPLAQLRQFREQVDQAFGRETQVIDEKIQVTQGFDVYLRTSSFEKTTTPIETLFALNSAGLIAGFFVQAQQKEAESKFLEYTTKTNLRLPFTEEWFVGWGGRTLEQNYHAAYSDQRFAYDLLIKRDGQTHRGDGKHNEDYFAFSQPILAPANARVVSSMNDVPDNTPGVMNPAQVAGNHVWLDFGNGEFALLAHFKQGSVLVKSGQQVTAGEQLGLCGNSGNSSEAHLHFHLQTTPDFGKGEGLPAQFVNYLADGAVIARGEPQKGQRIHNR
jgi:murein DD-endopeptidase MepM/ murein hydrolase activator NlpD